MTIKQEAAKYASKYELKRQAEEYIKTFIAGAKYMRELAIRAHRKLCDLYEEGNCMWPEGSACTDNCNRMKFFIDRLDNPQTL